MASAYAGILFGIFWLPLRALDGAGFPGIWASVVFIAVPLFLLAPVLIWRARVWFPGRVHFHAGGLCIGLAFALYSSAFVYTEVVRTVLLFYLTPVWGFLLARIVTGDRITVVRWLSVALAMAGLLAILGTGTGLPIPRNAGDWMALLSGMVWAVGSLLLLLDKESHPLDYGIAFFFWGAVWAGILGVLVTYQSGAATPDWAAIVEVLPWLLPVTLLVSLPAGFAVVFGPSELNPGVAGLLFMTEIIVASVSAALIAGEPFGIHETLGVLLVCLAGLLEPLSELRAARHARDPG